MVSSTPARLITPQAAADVLCVSRSKLYQLIGEGALASVRIDGSRRIDTADLQAFIDSRRESGSTPAQADIKAAAS